MDGNSLEMLEFPKIREILAGFTSFTVSHNLALTLGPSSDYQKISRLLKQSAEARHLLSIRPGFSIGGARDIYQSVMMAAKQKVLDPLTFLEIRDTLAAARVVRSAIDKLSSELPVLVEMTKFIVTKIEIEEEIDRCISSSGDILDAASTKLTNIRRRLKDTRQSLYERLDAMLKTKGKQKYLQEDPYVTEREGRYVLPVRTDFRKEFKGIVHDISNTGATIFIEPWETVEMGNELRQLVIEEKQEIEQILSFLSLKVGENESDICLNVSLLAEFDLALAKARFAEKYNAIEPCITCSHDRENAECSHVVLRLVGARHPLLKGKVVPLDVEIGHDYLALIITGPNTGGKTVALKTIGLLTLMTQAGMPIPASEESCIPVFDRVFADIGDQQSIEQTLSTFSWHMSNIIQIIANSTEHSLVLLDELGISTDPDEGAALARSILLYFLTRKTMTVATTHYSDLKAFAHSTAGVKNASLDFDSVTLSPKYHLTIGIPGRSNAISIASQLGLTTEIIETAKGMLSTGSQDMENLLADLMQEKQKLEKLIIEVEEKNNDVEKLKSHLERERQRLKEQEQKILQDVKDTLLSDAADLHKFIRQTESELRKSKKQLHVKRAKRVLENVYEQINQPLWKINTTDIDKTHNDTDLAIGDSVRIQNGNLEGKVLSLLNSSQELEVQVGNFILHVNKEDVEKIEKPVPIATPEFHMIKKRQNMKLNSLELDLRGKRADEVQGLLDRYINDAFLSGVKQVRVIHGYATGTVRQVTREILSSHPLVRSFHPGERSTGGDGVTLVDL